ncbi:hypothetical protein AMECASPLE_034220 [Ameca splendens]|uniref:Secreted protein n=1 Tax=Ameca splendens TaxID=208324 RepID=A0ABV1ADG4_9TELE
MRAWILSALKVVTTFAACGNLRWHQMHGRSWVHRCSPSASSGEKLKYPKLPPVLSFLSSLCMQKIQTLSPQENFTDYLLSGLHSGFKSLQASCERTWPTPHCAPLQDHPPGATSTSSASKTELPEPFTYPIFSRSVHHLTSPPPWRIS